jgi:hypothetical protein
MKDLTLQYPWALLLLLCIPVVLYLKRRYVSKTGFSGVSIVSKELGPSVVKKYWEDCFIILFLVASILAIVNIQYSSYWQKKYFESKWIMIVQDLSGSMNRSAGERGQLTLGDVALTGVQSFIDLRRTDDLIGIVGFSSYAQLIAPPTSDKEILKSKLQLLSRQSDSIAFREFTIGGATNASYATWLALCVFFMLLPEESQLSLAEINSLRYSLAGETTKKVEIPEKLKRIHFGQGMAIVLFSDGRIEANKSDEDIRKGLPNFANVIHLVKKLGVKLYLIAVAEDVSTEVTSVMEERQGSDYAGRIFYMPRRYDVEKIREVYNKINEMEKNKLLIKIFKKKKDTRWVFAITAVSLQIAYCFLQATPWLRRV